MFLLFLLLQTRSDGKHIISEDRVEVDFWGGEENDDVCLKALDKYIWGEDFADDDKLLLEVCTESST